MRLFISLRKLYRDRLYTLTSLFSLIILISSCSFILIYVANELLYDDHHQNHSRIYRISSVWNSPTSTDQMAITNGQVGEYLESNYSLVSRSARVSLIGKNPGFMWREQQLETKDFYRSEPSVLDIFTFKMINGSVGQALSKPGDLMINESYALKMFGTTDCLGERIETDGEALRITGVYEDFPQNVDLNINGLMYQSFDQRSYDQFAFYTYVLLQEDATETELEGALAETSIQLFGDNPKYDEDIRLKAESLNGLHFINDIKVDNPKGSLTNVKLMILAGLLLIIIVTVNLTNLNMVKSLEGLKKIALHRIMGASRRVIIMNFMLELLIIWVLAVIGSVFLLDLGEGSFTSMTGIVLAPVHFIYIAMFYLGTLFLCLFSGMIGIFYILSARPAQGLRKFYNPALPGDVIRKGLVTFQFVVASVLVTTFTVLLLQQAFINKKDLGYNPEGLMLLRVNDQTKQRMFIINELEQYLGTGRVAAFWQPQMGKDELMFSSIKLISEEGESQEVVSNDMIIDENYFEVLGIHKKKEELPSELSSQPMAYLNQTLIDQIAYDGRVAKFEYQWGTGGVVAGVVTDFHYQSMHSRIQPLVMVVDPEISNTWNGLYIRTRMDQMPRIRRILQDQFAEDVIDLMPVDQKLEAYYSREQNVLLLLGSFMVMGLVLAALGIYTVLAYLFRYRMFEIAMRKIMGADFRSLVVLFGREFVSVAVFTLLLALPIAMLTKDQLLAAFAYQVDLHWTIHLIPIGLLLAGMFTVVLFVALRAARLNPSWILHNE
ncbi:ABC transporter permease [Marinoscillum sp.]|uniref:ABC transporter permease n=1 Tax=Marinoscillum sp. TaxID=2024838 RepID=UPI003BABF327